MKHSKTEQLNFFQQFTGADGYYFSYTTYFVHFIAPYE